MCVCVCVCACVHACACMCVSATCCASLYWQRHHYDDHHAHEPQFRCMTVFESLCVGVSVFVFVCVSQPEGPNGEYDPTLGFTFG